MERLLRPKSFFLRQYLTFHFVSPALIHIKCTTTASIIKFHYPIYGLCTVKSVSLAVVVVNEVQWAKE